MKRHWLAVVGCLLLVSLGCEPSESSTSSGPTSERASVAFVTNQIADFWYIAEAGCRAAEEELGIEVEVWMPADATVVEQKRIVEDLMTRGIQGLAISPLDADNQQEWLNDIASRIPLITQDSDAPGTDRLVYVGMDNYVAGRACGELVRKALPDGGEVMIFVGRLEQDNAKYRRQGVIDVLLGRDRTAEFYQEQPNAWDGTNDSVAGNGYTILGTLLDTGKPEIAQRNAEDALNSYPDMDAMVGLFAYNPPACYQALQKASKLGKIQLIGFDESDVTLQAIKEGHCIGTVVQNPFEYGYESVRILKALIEGDRSVLPESKFVDIEPRTITIDEVDAFRADLEAKTSR